MHDLQSDPRLDTLTEAFRQRPCLREGARHHALSLVLSLLRWAAQKAPTGDLSPFPDEELEAALRWEGEPGCMMPLLQDAGFVDAARHVIGISQLLEARDRFLQHAFGEAGDEGA